MTYIKQKIDQVTPGYLAQFILTLLGSYITKEMKMFLHQYYNKLSEAIVGHVKEPEIKELIDACKTSIKSDYITKELKATVVERSEKILQLCQ